MTEVINISLACVTININTFDSFFFKTKPLRFGQKNLVEIYKKISKEGKSEQLNS